MSGNVDNPDVGILWNAGELIRAYCSDVTIALALGLSVVEEDWVIVTWLPGKTTMLLVA